MCVCTSVASDDDNIGMLRFTKHNINTSNQGDGLLLAQLKLINAFVIITITFTMIFLTVWLIIIF